MATPRFTGSALKVAQVDSVVVGGTVETGDKFIITVNTKAASTSATTTSTATTATEVDTTLGALDDDLYPEFTEFDATVSGSTVTLTGTEEGVPFTATATTTESNGGAADTQTFVLTNATAASGPEFWDTAANWSTGAVPVDLDSVYLDNYDGDILYGLAQSAVEPTLLEIAQSFTGTIGLPKNNENGYPEYRQDYLQIGPATCIIGRGPGSGSGRIKLDFTTDQVACVVENSGSPLEADLEAILLKGTNASNTLTVRGNASVGVAVFGGETATFATLSVEDNAQVRCGGGTTLTTLNVNGGELVISSNFTTLNVYGGIVTVNGTATAGQINCYRGLVIWNSTGTISGNTFVGEQGQIDFSQGIGSVTVSNPIEAYNPTPVIDPDRRVASLVIDFNGVDEPMAGMGANVRWTRAATA